MMQSIVDRITAISMVVGKIASWFSLGLVLVVFCDVVMRYLINTSFVFMQELEWHFFAFVFLMGAAYTLARDGHVRGWIFCIKRWTKRSGPGPTCWAPSCS